VKGWGAALGAIAVLLASGAFIYVQREKLPTNASPEAGITESAAQLPVEKQPKVELSFSADARFATVNLTNLNAAQMEYNLIYEATAKKQRIQTGVNDSQDVSGKSTYTKKQLLGSESSGKFTYHENIQNATMELVLRDAQGRSIFNATYPFEVTPGKSATLTASE
jgi:phosphopantothenate synthetase